MAQTKSESCHFLGRRVPYARLGQVFEFNINPAFILSEAIRNMSWTTGFNFLCQVSPKARNPLGYRET